MDAPLWCCEMAQFHKQDPARAFQGQPGQERQSARSFAADFCSHGLAMLCDAPSREFGRREKKGR